MKPTKITFTYTLLRLFRMDAWYDVGAGVEFRISQLIAYPIQETTHAVFIFNHDKHRS